MRVACFSVAALDYFPQQKKYYAGGNSLNQAIWFKKLGFKSSFIGAIGTDDSGNLIEQLLNKNHVDVSHLYRVQGITANNQIINDKKGERFGVEGAWQNGVYDTFLLSEHDWAYIENFEIWSTHVNGRNFLESLRRKKTNNFLVVDFLHFNNYELLIEGFNTIDIAYFGGCSGQLNDLIKISKDFKGLIVLTLGSEGSIAIRSGETHFQPALPLERVIDTTGCGDAFQSGFTVNYFVSQDIKRSLQTGAKMGRIAAMNYGGVCWEE